MNENDFKDLIGEFFENLIGSWSSWYSRIGAAVGALIGGYFGFKAAGVAGAILGVIGGTVVGAILGISSMLIVQLAVVVGGMVLVVWLLCDLLGLGKPWRK